MTVRTLLLVLAALLAGCTKPEPPKPEPQPAVAGDKLTFPDGKDPPGLRVAIVGSTGAHSITVPGRLVWDEDHTTRVYAPFAGRLDKVRVAVGQPVRRGQPLADVASADVGQAQADLHKAETDLVLAKSNVERTRELVGAGVVAGKELQQAEADQARANAESARTRARLKQYGVRADTVTQGLALVAPLDGVVIERNASAGGEVRTEVAGQPLFVISDPTQLSALLDVDETQLSAFKPGDALELRSAAWPDIEFKARVTAVAETLDPTTRTIKVRATVPNQQHKLKAEMFVSATAIQPVSLPQVPADAVYLRGEKSYLFVQTAPGRFERREVSLRSAGPQSWMALRGVTPGERVVIGGGLYFNQLLDAAR